MARREIMGFWFDPASGLFFPDESGTVSVSDFTFNDLHNMSTVFGNRPMNPFFAPTAETAQRVFEWAQRVVNGHALIHLRMEPIKSSPWARWSHNEWSIYAETTNMEGLSEPLSVGLWASSLMRNGEKWPARALEAELRQMGAWA